MTPQDSPVEKIIKGLIVFATSEALRDNGLHFSAEDKALAKGIQPLTKAEATKDIETLLLEAEHKGFLLGWEAGQDAANGTMKGMSLEEGKRQLFKANPELKAEYERQRKLKGSKS